MPVLARTSNNLTHRPGRRHQEGTLSSAWTCTAHGMADRWRWGARRMLAPPCSAVGQFMSLFEVEVEVEVNLRPTFSRPVCPGVMRPSGTFDQFFFRHEIFCRQLRLCCFVAPSLTRRRVCNLLFNCFWAMPEQSLLSRSPCTATRLFNKAWYSPLENPWTRWRHDAGPNWRRTHGDASLSFLRTSAVYRGLGSYAWAQHLWSNKTNVSIMYKITTVNLAALKYFNFWLL
jgi:hypothetical protein